MRRILLEWVAITGLAAVLAGCVTVKPQERATLADPTMVFDDEAKARGQMQHALDNREGAYGGSGVAGGGCGCNSTRPACRGAAPLRERGTIRAGAPSASSAGRAALSARARRGDPHHGRYRECALKPSRWTLRNMVYTEAPTGSRMTVYTPAGSVEASPSDWLQVRAGWEADVVSGASVAVKAGAAYQANHPGADVITAASVHDLRNQATGGVTLKSDRIALTAGYAYSTENDSRSNSINVAARTDHFQHDTQLEIAYARNFDQVCERVQTSSDPAPRWGRSRVTTRVVSTSNPLRVTLPIGIDAFQGSWTQAWTSVFTTQVAHTGQVTNGFQSNPYRGVVLAEGVKAQEHIPDNRAREALAVRGNLFLKPIKAALRLGVRGYWDTWGVSAGDVELELEKYVGTHVRVSARGRLYAQTGALFWSDDYTGGNPPAGPKGQYWTGDRVSCRRSRATWGACMGDLIR